MPGRTENALAEREASMDGSARARPPCAGRGSRVTPSNAVRLQLFALAYNLANFLRSLALPDEAAQWTLTSLREKPVKIGARVGRHGRYVVFQLAEVAVPRTLFTKILRRIERLRGPPVPAS